MLMVLSQAILVVHFLVFCNVEAKVVLYPHGSEISLCEGAVLSLTCVSDTGHINWSLGGTSKTFWSVSSPFALDDSVIVTPVSESAGVFTSVATVVQAPATLNGTVLECSDGLLLGATTELVTIIVSDSLPSVSNLMFKALNFTSATLMWTISTDSCIDNYNIQLESVSTGELVHDINTTATSLDVTELHRGMEYFVTVSVLDMNEGVGKITTIMSLDVPYRVTTLKVNCLQNCDGVVIALWKQPPSSRPPVVYYLVLHNVTSNGNAKNESTKMTNITIHGALPGHVYYIQVTPVNVLGSGQSVSYVVGPLGVPVSNTTSCSCAVELGVTLPLCALLLVVGCCMSVFVTVNKDRIVHVAKVLLTPKPSLHRNESIDLQDPNVMNQNLAYEEQEPGYTDKTHPYNNANTTLIRVACHVYDEPVKIKRPTNNIDKN